MRDLRTQSFARGIPDSASDRPRLNRLAHRARHAVAPGRHAGRRHRSAGRACSHSRPIESPLLRSYIRRRCQNREHAARSVSSARATSETRRTLEQQTAASRVLRSSAAPPTDITRVDRWSSAATLCQAQNSSDRASASSRDDAAIEPVRGGRAGDPRGGAGAPDHARLRLRPDDRRPAGHQCRTSSPGRCRVIGHRRRDPAPGHPHHSGRALVRAGVPIRSHDAVLPSRRGRSPTARSRSSEAFADRAVIAIEARRWFEQLERATPI